MAILWELEYPWLLWKNMDYLVLSLYFAALLGIVVGKIVESKGARFGVVDIMACYCL